jgi:hypothetical protein
MSEADFGRWQAMASAPRDGTRILVELRASEQGPAEVDMVRWARPDREAEACWLSTDSDPGVAIIYAEAELAGWMALPTPLPKLRSVQGGADPDEIGGSGI